jgi:hypothetical protein
LPLPVARMRPAALAPLAAALVLAVLALPRAGAALEAVYAGSVGEFVGTDVYGTPAETARAAGILEAVDDRFGDARARVRAGTLRSFLAYAVAPAGDRGQLTRAAADLASGLARAPAVDPMAWAALAQARLGLGDRAAAARALAMSMRLAVYEPRLALWRAELGVALIDRLDPEPRRQWMRQVQIAWPIAQPGLLALARRDPAAQALLTLALASQPQMLRQFQMALSGR